MTGVDISELEKLSKTMTELSERIPQYKRQLHQEIAAAALDEVREAIGQKAKGGKTTGALAGWQEYSTGKYGGYAKIQPKRNTFEKGYAVGYITNAAENGHRIRRPSGKWRHYRARIVHRYVTGLGFYELARGKAEKIAIDAAEELLSKIAGKMQA